VGDLEGDVLERAAVAETLRQVADHQSWGRATGQLLLPSGGRSVVRQI
jgi:hypothetical protein